MRYRSRYKSLNAAGSATVLVVFSLLQAMPIRAQLLSAGDGPLPSFEVATVRPSNADGGLNYRISTERFKAENAPVTALIRFAYNIKSDDQLPKEPNWIASERFDIDAKVDEAEVRAMGKMLPEQKFAQYRLMVQALLMDRFKLKVSTRMKELPVYALAVAKNGPHLSPVSVSAEAVMQHMPTLTGGSRGELKAGAVSMAFFTEWLSGKPETGGRVVMDATGLKGSYDFALNWTPDDGHVAQPNPGGTNQGTNQGPATAASPDSSAPSFFTALQEQLGLKLEPRRAPAEVLVIDHVERPSPN